jgi:putative transposase
MAPRIGTRAACRAAGVAQATWYRRHRASPAPHRPAPVPHRDRPQLRALSPAERAAILDALHCPQFADLAPAEVWAILLDEGTYLGSQSTFYRLLRAAGETRERRRHAVHPAAVKPELAATGPNQVYSWDITKLHGPAKWTYYHLYMILDIFNRYAVGATRESAALAEKLIASTCAKQAITAGQLTIHADRGSSMTSRPVAFLLADLGITQSHSRPHVSNDNPFSEAQFKTLKYRPYFPARFTSIEHARAHCQEFFRWYNHEHRHGGLGLHTAADIHHGHAASIQAERAQVLATAYRAPPRALRPQASRPARPPVRILDQPTPGERRHHSIRPIRWRVIQVDRFRHPARLLSTGAETETSRRGSISRV